MKTLDLSSYLDIIPSIREISRGDTVYVISEVLAFVMAVRSNGEKFDANRFIDTLKNAVGEEGTILFPTFNWGFCKGQPFSMRETASLTGSLTSVALKRADFRRTKHPIYSFAVWGRHADEMAAIDPADGWGAGTVFDMMHKLSAKSLVIGLSLLAGMTFYNHVEKIASVPYRYEKNFTASYTDMAGSESVKTYTMYVRDLDIDPVHIDYKSPLNEVAETLGVSRSYSWRDVPFRVAELTGIYDLIDIELRYNGAKNLYEFSRPELMKG